MKALLTGSRGTVGRALALRLRERGAEIAVWDRALVPIDHYDTMDRFVGEVAPDVVYHLAIAAQPTGRANEGWLVNYEWPSELAWICRQRRIRFIFTSTAMVFSSSAKGPFTLSSVPDAGDGYGYEKRRAEERVFHQNPDATVARLGWQIGDAAGTNNMLDYFERRTVEHGHVGASTRWLPACSFLPDTADALVRLARESAGLYMVDGNTKWTFFEIAEALNVRQSRRWKIVPTDDFDQDQRMLDPRLEVASLATRLPELR